MLLGSFHVVLPPMTANKDEDRNPNRRTEVCPMKTAYLNSRLRTQTEPDKTRSCLELLT